MTEIDTDPPHAPAMTELQRIARDSLVATVRLCDATGLALVPGPTSVTVYAPQPRRPSAFSLVETLDLPQIPTQPLGRPAPRRRRTSP